ncbi:MAG: C45 family autoproteolytic acyltransferase/hydrolase [Albidovulum sp.]|nr:C45 family autoproteolytic acyltransferase/hydrolase [Albidovulum sp.]
MNFKFVPIGIPVDLSGPPYERGLQQAKSCPNTVGAVRRSVALRMEESAAVLSDAGVRSYLEDLRRFHKEHDPDIMEEIEGIGAGFDIPVERLFDYLMLSLAEDFGRAGGDSEECTAFAASTAERGAILAKNRDYRREHIAIQRVFRHRDPAWNGRQVLCVGSLGSPGNFSSGMNSDGFALADTSSRTSSHRVGRHRYFLLNRLQTRCASVADALQEIAATPHAGGGTLVLGDAAGCMAAVELGSSSVAIEIRREGKIGRTNHYVGASTAELNRRDDIASGRFRNSKRRLTTLHDLLSGASNCMGLEGAAGILGFRGQNGCESLYRMGGEDLSATISCSIYATGQKRMWFTSGNPSGGDWTSFDFGGDTS